MLPAEPVLKEPDPDVAVELSLPLLLLLPLPPVEELLVGPPMPPVAVEERTCCVKLPQFSLVPLAAWMTTERFPKKATLSGSVDTYRSR